MSVGPVADQSPTIADQTMLRDWPAFARAAAAAYQHRDEPNPPAAALLLGAAAATVHLTNPDRGPAAAAGTVDNPFLPPVTISGPDLDQAVLQTVHATFRAAQRSDAGPVTVWLDHTERALVDHLMQPPTPLGAALSQWQAALGTITTDHPVVGISIAETQRRVTAAARRDAEDVLLDGVATLTWFSVPLPLTYLL